MHMASFHGPVIVGANGYIGRHVCAEYAEHGDRFTATTRGDATHLQSAFPLATAIGGVSLADPRTFEGLTRQPSFVLLATASVPSTFRSLRDEAMHNLLPFVGLFERIEPGSRVIYISSGGTVYGHVSTPNSLLAEDAPMAPISPYGQNKIFIEEALKYYARTRGFNYVILRPSNPVGPDFVAPNLGAAPRPQGVVTIFLRRIAQSLPIKVFGDGEAERDYFDVRDLARAIRLIEQSPDIIDVTLNVGMGVGVTVNKLIAIMRAQVGFEFSVDRVPARDFDVRRVVLDTQKIRDISTWTPDISLEVSVSDVWKLISQSNLS
jgi:UDP-glucose 4-epimerase